MDAEVRVVTKASILIASITVLGACAAVLGVDGYEPVPCVGNDCTPPMPIDGGGSDAPPSSVVDARPAVDADGPPSPPIDSGSDGGCSLDPCATGVRVVVRFTSSGTSRLLSEPSGLSIAPNSSGTACLNGGEVRLSLASDGLADYSGVTCRDGNRTDRCRFQLGAPVCIDVVAR